MSKRIGLALSGGVLRGIAHLGVLSVLVEAGIPIACVAGASVGAIIGATYCAGMDVKTVSDIAAQISWRKVSSLTWPTRGGLVTFDKMERWLVSVLGDVNFADLKLPFAVVASDLEKGQPVVFRQGRVAPVVRATCSVPGFVVPVRLGDYLLGDGGVTNNLPVSVLKEMGADYVIGVDLFAPSIRRWLGPLGFGITAIEIMVQRAGLGVETADCLIAPDLAGFSYVSFSKRDKLIALGRKAAEEKLPLIHAALG